MAKLTSTRWAKAVATVEQGLEQCITAAADQAAGYRNLLFAIRGVDPLALTPRQVAPPAAPTTTAKGKRPQAGSLPARILDILGEIDQDEVTIKQVMAAKPGANENAVRYQLQQLVKAGWVMAVGATSQRRYLLPKKRGR
jgi:hypothetical protein